MKKQMTTPDPGEVVSCVVNEGWLSLKVAWPVDSATQMHLAGRTASGVRKHGVTAACRRYNRVGDQGVWEFNTTKGLKAENLKGENIENLSSGDRVVITHTKHFRPGNIFLAPELIVVQD